MFLYKGIQFYLIENFVQWNLLIACYWSCLCLSLLLVASIHWFAQSYCKATNATTTTMPRLLLLYQFKLAEICICHKPCPTRDEMRDLQIAHPRTLMLPFFFYTSGTPHGRHFCTCLELWGRPFHSSLLSFSLPSFLPFKVAMKGIQSTQLCCYISFFSRLFGSPPVFLSSQGRLLDSHKRWLFCLHIQHTTHCLFERRTPIGSLEVAVCGFCFSISLHTNGNIFRL